MCDKDIHFYGRIEKKHEALGSTGAGLRGRVDERPAGTLREVRGHVPGLGRHGEGGLGSVLGDPAGDRGAPRRVVDLARGEEPRLFLFQVVGESFERELATVGQAQKGVADREARRWKRCR